MAERGEGLAQIKGEVETEKRNAIGGARPGRSRAHERRNGVFARSGRPMLKTGLYGFFTRKYGNAI